MKRNLDDEEAKAVTAIEEKYLALHEMYARCKEQKRPEVNTSCPDITG